MNTRQKQHDFVRQFVASAKNMGAAVYAGKSFAVARLSKHNPTAKQLRERVRQTMARHNRCDVKIFELLRAWENQIDADKDAFEDFTMWCCRHGWRAGRGADCPQSPELLTYGYGKCPFFPPSRPLRLGQEGRPDCYRSKKRTGLGPQPPVPENARNPRKSSESVIPMSGVLESL